MSGSSLDDFLRDEGILEEVEAAALKRVVALQLEDIIKKERLKKNIRRTAHAHITGGS